MEVHAFITRVLDANRFAGQPTWRKGRMAVRTGIVLLVLLS